MYKKDVQDDGLNAPSFGMSSFFGRGDVNNSGVSGVIGEDFRPSTAKFNSMVSRESKMGEVVIQSKKESAVHDLSEITGRSGSEAGLQADSFIPNNLNED